MEIMELKPIVEAMIFVAEEPITEGTLLAALTDAGVDKEALQQTIAAIKGEWNADQTRGIALSEVAGGYQFRTKPSHAGWLKRLNVPRPMRLSGPALETLAIIAYRQPIVRSEIEKIRGVDTGGVLKTLLDRRLLRIVGRRDEPGQPLLYGTTNEFLEIFNLKGLTDLPTLKDIEELMRERRTLTESRAGTAKKSGGLDDDDDEEPTEVIDDDDSGDDNDDDDEPELIHRRPLDEDGEEEGSDMEALTDLEESLKGLRRLERNIFPKEQEEAANAVAGGQANAEAGTVSAPAAGGQLEGEAKPAQHQEAAADGGGADAPGADDSPF